MIFLENEAHFFLSKQRIKIINSNREKMSVVRNLENIYPVVSTLVYRILVSPL